MAKKGKNRHPNAPELQTILLESPIGQQPAHNPYYPDISQLAPPPYSDLSSGETIRMTNNNIVPNDSSNPRYQRFSNVSPAQPTVIVQRVASSGHDFYYARYISKVKSYTSSMISICVIAILLSIVTQHLYSLRNCIDGFVIHQPTPDVLLRVKDLKQMSFNVIALSVIMLVVCIIKTMIGYGKSSACYLFLMAILAFVGTLTTGYMAYLSFYNPCVVSLNELLSKSTKTVFSEFASLLDSKVPVPEKGLFGESNVFQYIKEDNYGVVIFGINVLLCIFYFSGLMSAITTC